GQGFQLQQPQDKVLVTAGQTLNLTCTVSGYGLPGPVRWLKGWGSGNKTIYDQKDTSFHRVTRVAAESNSDFSIRIMDFQPEDAGTYYCVKLHKSLDGVDEVFRHGHGTEVSVQGEWGSQGSSRWEPALPGAAPGTARPFPARWLCSGRAGMGKGLGGQLQEREGPVGPKPCEVRAGWGRRWGRPAAVGLGVLGQGRGTPRAAEPGDTRHQELLFFPVPPSVSVAPDAPSPVKLNKTLNFTCHVKGFYPGDVAVTWLENGTEVKVENIRRPEENRRGLFDLSSLVEVKATEEKNGSEFTCRVVHNGQDPVSQTAALWIAAPARE
ncbi:SHPS1 phosphatase, partial [Mesembrinibis cayennensis]|nr:SHPS1 phosphatase [Mesembrinibis cayennensis]